MKIIFAATALMLLTGAAYAGESNGEPFPYQSPTQPYSLQNVKQGLSVSQNPFPFLVPGTPMNTSQVISPDGAAGEVQSVASLPRGFEDGTAVGQNQNHIAPSPTRLAQPSAPGNGRNG